MGCPSSYNTAATKPVLFSMAKQVASMKQAQAEVAKLNYLSSLSEQLWACWLLSGAKPLTKAVNWTTVTTVAATVSKLDYGWSLSTYPEIT